MHQIEIASEHELLQPGSDVHRESEIRHASVDSDGEAVADRHHRDPVTGLQGPDARQGK